MKAVKTTGFLRIWKVILFMMAMVLFAACFKNTALAASSWTFNYTGNVQSWTCPATGTYKLETWGAEGGKTDRVSGGIGGDNSYRHAGGGYGGYSSGCINLQAGQILYITVGGKGTDSPGLPDNGTYSSRLDNDATKGGYNGGGNGGAGCSNSSSRRGNFGAGGAGGGATHIATTNRGVLSNYRSYQNDVLIVAGGGGGAGGFVTGGAGGGATGGASDSGYNRSNGGTQSSGYAFGQGAYGDSGDPYSSDKTNHSSNGGGWNMYEGRGGSGGGWYGGYRCNNHSCQNGTNVGGGGGSGHLNSKLTSGSMQSGVRSGNGFARITSTHTHNSNGVGYVISNPNDVYNSTHQKYTYCDAHGTDTTQNRIWSKSEPHTWTHKNNTTDECVCGFTKIRRYNVDVDIMNPEGKQTRPDGEYGYAYVKFKSTRNNADWSEEVTDNDTRTCQFQYGDKFYIKYIRPYYDYLEFKSISTTNNKGLESLGDYTWCYTVTDNQFINVNGGDFANGGEIRIDMDYKHTSLILAPNKGYIDGSPNNVTLQTPMQYNTSVWNDISSQTPVRAGYTFTGWYDSATDGTMVYDAHGKCVRGTVYFDKNGNSLCTSNLTVYAHWTPTKYQIKYILFNGSAEKVIEYTIEDTIRIPNASLNGYDFIGWTMSCKNGSVGDGNKTISANVSVPTKDLVIKGLYGDLTLTANYTKSKANTDTGYNKTPDDDGTPDHITDTGSRKTPLVTDGGTKHNMFRVTQT